MKNLEIEKTFETLFEHCLRSDLESLSKYLERL